MWAAEQEDSAGLDTAGVCQWGSNPRYKRTLIILLHF